MAADDGVELVQYLFPNNPVPDPSLVSYFIPLQLLRDQTESKAKGISSRNDHDSSATNICSFIGTPGAIVVPCYGNNNIQNSEEQKIGIIDRNVLPQDSLRSCGEWIKSRKESTLMHLITSNGFTDADSPMNSEIINSVLSFDYISVAYRSKVLSTCSVARKECNIFNINISSQNIITGNSPPVSVKIDSRIGSRITFFSASDIGIKLYGSNGNKKSAGNRRNLEKDRNMDEQSAFNLSSNRVNTATFHPEDSSEKERSRNVLMGKNILLLVGDSDGKIHYSIASKSSLFSSGIFQAHSSPIVSALSTGNSCTIIYVFS